MVDHFKANGKLLLSAEYFILDGATAFVLPIRLGQRLKVLEIQRYKDQIIEWKAFCKGQLWFDTKLKIPELAVIETSDQNIALRLRNIFTRLLRLNPTIFQDRPSLRFLSDLDFNAEWGLGSSSSLIFNLAAWAKINPMELYRSTSNGSGYDIEAAGRNQPFLFNLAKGKPDIVNADLSSRIKPNLYFVYSGKKQKSHREILKYRQIKTPAKKLFNRISAISKELTLVHELSIFEDLIREHERIIANHLGRIPVKQLLFPDYSGEVKSLGAWGGDFFLLTYRGEREQLKKYLTEKGLNTFFSYEELRCR